MDNYRLIASDLSTPGNIYTFDRWEKLVAGAWVAPTVPDATSRVIVVTETDKQSYRAVFKKLEGVVRVVITADENGIKVGTVTLDPGGAVPADGIVKYTEDPDHIVYTAAATATGWEFKGYYKLDGTLYGGAAEGDLTWNDKDATSLDTGIVFAKFVKSGQSFKLVINQESPAHGGFFKSYNADHDEYYNELDYTATGNEIFQADLNGNNEFCFYAVGDMGTVTTYKVVGWAGPNDANAADADEELIRKVGNQYCINMADDRAIYPDFEEVFEVVVTQLEPANPAIPLNLNAGTNNFTKLMVDVHTNVGGTPAPNELKDCEIDVVNYAITCYFPPATPSVEIFADPEMVVNNNPADNSKYEFKRWLNIADNENATEIVAGGSLTIGTSGQLVISAITQDWYINADYKRYYKLHLTENVVACDDDGYCKDSKYTFDPAGVEDELG
jgi:hypothetical protein